MYSFCITRYGKIVPVVIRNGLAYSANSEERVEIGATVDTKDGIYKRTGINKSEKVKKHNKPKMSLWHDGVYGAGYFG